MAIKYGSSQIKGTAEIIKIPKDKVFVYHIGIIPEIKGTAEVGCSASGSVVSDIPIEAGLNSITVTSGTKKGRMIELTSRIADAKTKFVPFNDFCFIFNGKELLYYTYESEEVNGVITTTKDQIKPLSNDAYVPKITLGRPPSGGGTPNEKLNYLSDSWIDSFSADGTAKDYTLSFDGITAGSVKVTVDGTTKTETTDYTVDYKLGKVTFVTAPVEGTNNVEIQAAKDGLMKRELINECKYAIVYGGANDTRMFISGNKEGAVYWCDVMNPFYWPEDCYAFIGSDSEKVAGLVIHYLDLIVLKERSIHRITATLGTDGTISFKSYPVNSSIGCDIPESIQIINNNVVLANTYAGVHILTRTDVREEKNVLPISGNINGLPSRTGLLNEPNLTEATSVDYDEKYHLCVNDKVYVWDYNLTPYTGDEKSLAWFRYDNMNANVWFMRGLDLYYGKRDKGEMVHIKKTNSLWDEKLITDFDNPIKAYWKSKVLNFGTPNWRKTVKELHFRAKSALNTRLTIQYFNDQGDVMKPIELVASSFAYDTFDYNTFSYDIHNFPPVFRLRPKMKRIIYFQFEVINNELFQDISLMDLMIAQNPTKQVK